MARTGTLYDRTIASFSSNDITSRISGQMICETAPGQLMEVNPTSGIYKYGLSTPVCTFPSGFYCFFNFIVLSNYMYGVFSNMSTECRLYKINLSTWAMTLIKTYGSLGGGLPCYGYIVAPYGSRDPAYGGIMIYGDDHDYVESIRFSDDTIMWTRDLDVSDSQNPTAICAEESLLWFITYQSGPTYRVSNSPYTSYSRTTTRVTSALTGGNGMGNNGYHWAADVPGILYNADGTLSWNIGYHLAGGVYKVGDEGTDTIWVAGTTNGTYVCKLANAGTTVTKTQVISTACHGDSTYMRSYFTRGQAHGGLHSCGTGYIYYDTSDYGHYRYLNNSRGDCS